MDQVEASKECESAPEDEEKVDDVTGLPTRSVDNREYRDGIERIKCKTESLL
jgi:hypothetical protein